MLRGVARIVAYNKRLATITIYVTLIGFLFFLLNLHSGTGTLASVYLFMNRVYVYLLLFFFGSILFLLLAGLIEKLIRAFFG